MRQNLSWTFKSSIMTLLWFNRYHTPASQRLYIKFSLTRLMLFICWLPWLFCFLFCMSLASAFVYAWCIALRVWNDGRRRYTFPCTEVVMSWEEQKTADVYWYGRSIWKSVGVINIAENFFPPPFFFLGYDQVPNSGFSMSGG